MAGGKSLGENYAFAGMHHVFDQHAEAGGYFQLSPMQFIVSQTFICTNGPQCYFFSWFIFFLVTAIKFAHDEKHQLACSSADGTISVCHLIPSPPSVSCFLRGHNAAIKGTKPSNMH
jgi:hypothetical protein